MASPFYTKLHTNQNAAALCVMFTGAVVNKNQILKEFRCKTLSVMKKFRELDSENIKSIEFDATSLSSETEIEAIHCKFPTDSQMLAPNYLYIVEFKEGTSIEVIQSSRGMFQRLRAERTVNFSRDNVENPTNCFIYVGTSESIKGRFRTHLGKGNGRTTWALYLRLWLIEGSIVVTTVPLLNFTSDESQLLEDVIWDGCKPMCGKKGGK